MTQIYVFADGNPLGLGDLRADAVSVAGDYLRRVLWPALSIEGDCIVMNDSARFALAHLCAALPDHVITALCDQCDARAEAESHGLTPKPWSPPPPSPWGAA